MTSVKTISVTDLKALVSDLVQAGTTVVAPVQLSDFQENGVRYQPISKYEDAVLGIDLPNLSLKEFFLPCTEELLRFSQSKSDVGLNASSGEFAPAVVLGAKPCDAAGLPIVDKVMDWDYHDEPWFGRRESTTIIGMACPGVDDVCFCTAVGLDPGSSKGSDLLLIPISSGYEVEVATPKGQALIDAHSARFKDAQNSSEAEAFVKKSRDKVTGNLSLNPEVLKQWLDDNFEHDFFNKIALNCHGCGACASVCPTCHCFDIVDEPEGLKGGCRRRNWDTCQSGIFTLHGSGHNPRADQNARFRQRVIHKFAIYPERFDAILCTGCGRCTRVCAGGMNLNDILTQVSALATGGGVKDGGTP